MLTLTQEYFATPHLSLSHNDATRNILNEHKYDGLVHYYSGDKHTFINLEGNEEIAPIPWELGDAILKYASNHYYYELETYGAFLERNIELSVLSTYQPPEEKSFPSQKIYALEYQKEGTIAPLLQAVAAIKETTVEEVVKTILEKSQALEALGALNGNLKRKILAKAAATQLDHQGYLKFKDQLDRALYKTPDKAMEALYGKT